jgi:hypothetical protein
MAIEPAILNFSGHEHLKKFSVQTKRPVASHVGHGRILAPFPYQSFEVVSVVPRDQGPSVTYWIAVVLRIEIENGQAVGVQMGSPSRKPQVLVLWCGKNVGTTWFYHSHDLTEGTIWMKYVLHHVLSDEQVECIRWKCQSLNIFTAPTTCLFAG